MAKIPDVSALGARGTPTALQPLVREPGRESARARQGLGQTLGKVGDDMYRRQAETEVTEARNAFNEFEAGLADPEKGLASKKGKDAFDLADKIPKQFDDFSGKFIAGLKNKKAREYASELAASRRMQIATTVGHYVTRERESYEEDTFNAGLTSSAQRVARDPAKFDDELTLQTAALTGRLTRKGRGELVEGAVGGLKAAMRGSVVDGMIGRGQYQQARAYFQQHVADFGDKSDEYGKRTAGAIEHELLVQERRIGMAERDTRKQASTTLESSDPTLPIDQVLGPMLPAINAQPGLRDQLERRQRERLQGLEVQTDPREKERLRTLMGKDPQAFLQTDLTTSYPKLSIADRDYFETQQKAFADPAKQAKFATESQLLGQAYDEMRIPGGKDGMNARGKFEGLYLAEKQAFVQTNKREPTADEMASMIKTLKLPFVKQGWFFDDTKRLYELDPEKDGDVVVPEADRAAIVARNAGKPDLTEAQIRQAYILWKRK